MAKLIENSRMFLLILLLQSCGSGFVNIEERSVNNKYNLEFVGIANNDPVLTNVYILYVTPSREQWIRFFRSIRVAEFRTKSPIQQYSLKFDGKCYNLDIYMKVQNIDRIRYHKIGGDYNWLDFATTLPDGAKFCIDTNFIDPNGDIFDGFVGPGSDPLPSRD